MRFFMHRIQKNGDDFQKGIEVHETLDAAVLSFWGRMKTAYGKSENTFVSCKITDENGNIVAPYNMTWIAETENAENKWFLHHIRIDNGSVSKDIDVLSSADTAYGDFAENMEYGYGNPKFPGVSFVSCFITDMLSGGMVLMDATWKKPEEPVEEEPGEVEA